MFQIGATDGNRARHFAELGWDVYAFDAHPRYANIDVQAGHGSLENLHYRNMAIALDDEVTATFYASEEFPGISSLGRTHRTQEAITVPATSLKRFYHEYSVRAIDFFMIDAETMDLEIMKTHDWDVPISALLMECTPRSVRAIADYVTAQVPEYRAVVFEWRKPRPGPGQPRTCIRMCSVSEYGGVVPGPWGTFGNVLFYR